jgi:DNA repair exonuclease SbcCD ATPase subunit
MKFKLAILILVLACVGLGIALYTTKKSGEKVHTEDVVYIMDYSNQLVDVSVQLKDLREVNISLTNDLALSRQQIQELSNTLASANIVIAETKTSLAGAQDQITNLAVHVADLELQNKSLDEHASELTNTIAQLDAQIAATQSRLALTETNSAFLQAELQKQMAQRAEIEHKFNDITEVRSQVVKLKEEIFIARRMQLMKNDNGGMKGAQLLMKRTPPPETNKPAAKVPGNYDLNVEVGSDGSVKIIPPAGATTTNSAAP